MKAGIKILKEHDLYPILLIKIRSRSHPNTFHYVRYYKDKHFECPCIYFEMKHKECNHIKQAKIIIQNKNGNQQSTN